MRDSKSTFNTEQQRAVDHVDGPAMVLAGPGSGKTTVITNRVLNLIENHKVDPRNILVVTFSKAAAVEMSERFRALAGRNYPVRFGTFHSVFFQMLRVCYHYEAKDIVTPALKYRFLDEALSESGFAVEDRKEFLEDVEKEISKVKGAGIDISCYYSANCPEEVFRQLYCGYQERLQRHRALDFDDMVVYTYELLRQRPDILKKWQAVFRYILIDEFQDINHLQYENVKMLAEPENNLFIVGDDDQSIYGFRGARPDIMLSFPKQYPGAERIVLGTNYRCSSYILKAGSNLIGYNKKRYDKKLRAEKETGEKVHIKKCKTLSTEAEQMIQQIDSYHRSGMAYEDMAVLFRTNMQMRTLAGKLLERGLPFVMKESLPNMFETWMARDILCYVKIALGDQNRQNYLQICNRPLRYISRGAFDTPMVTMGGLKGYYMRKNQPWMLERITDFENELRTIRTLSPYSALHYIRKGIGYDEFLETYAKERNVNADDWFEVLEEIQETTKECKSLVEWLAYAENYGDLLKEMSEKKAGAKEEKKGINLMTMHSSKGLEFEAVFIPTVNEDVCPYRKSIQSGEIEEERRMLYVAMTRAKEYLHLSFVEERFNKDAEPSRFIEEISPELAKQKR
ncbi:MAG: ATP-dependent helicase [Eubacterium sp.]|nr:ATP-dependent helicase [Eubacterium sp.]